MDFHINLNTILEGIILLGIVGIFKLLWGTNERLTTSEVWQKEHDKQDDERYQTLTKSQDAIWERIDSVLRS